MLAHLVAECILRSGGFRPARDSICSSRWLSYICSIQSSAIACTGLVAAKRGLSSCHPPWARYRLLQPVIGQLLEAVIASQLFPVWQGKEGRRLLHNFIRGYEDGSSMRVRCQVKVSTFKTVVPWTRSRSATTDSCSSEVLHTALCEPASNPG